MILRRYIDFTSYLYIGANLRRFASKPKQLEHSVILVLALCLVLVIVLSLVLIVALSSVLAVVLCLILIVVLSLVVAVVHTIHHPYHYSRCSHEHRTNNISNTRHNMCLYFLKKYRF